MFCCEPNKELDDAGSEPVNNNKTPIKSTTTNFYLFFYRPDFT